MHFLIPTSIQLHGLLKSVLCPVFCVCVSLTALELRLKDGRHRCEGRVELKHQGKWGTVNYAYWGLPGATVVCRQLECGTAVDAPKASYFGQGDGPIWLYALCEGTESTLTDCRHPNITDYRTKGASHDWDAGAVCSGKACLVWEGSPAGKASVYSQSTYKKTRSQPFEHNFVKTPITQ